MTLFWIVVIIVVVWWLAGRSKKTAGVSVSDQENTQDDKISEEVVFNAQARFEKKLTEEIDFPD